MAETSIYEYITDHIVDGVLPPDFSLDCYDKGDDQISFADGALDGIAIYHTAGPDLPSDLTESIAAGISQACIGEYEIANNLLGKLGNQHRAIALIDELQHYIVEHSASINAPELWAYSTHLLFFSDDKELVKIGLSLIELFGEPEENVKEVVRTLGLSDEFTLFAAWCARNWADGNEELFQLAKNANGWGRIHVVEMLAPETDEIRDWLLHEGANNTVMPEYSALTCYVKAGVGERLSRELGHDDFSAVTSLVHAALSDAPIAGISALENPKAELCRYVEQAAHQPLDQQDRECLAAIAAFAQERNWQDLCAQCNALL